MARTLDCLVRAAQPPRRCPNSVVAKTGPAQYLNLFVALCMPETRTALRAAGCMGAAVRYLDTTINVFSRKTRSANRDASTIYPTWQVSGGGMVA
jgi:hypothetical protein